MGLEGVKGAEPGFQRGCKSSLNYQKKEEPHIFIDYSNELLV